MGAIAEGIMAYAQPLIDQADGSMEQLNKALAISQLCWNLAVSPEVVRNQMFSEIRTSLNMDEAEFNDFRQSIIDPMIQRHYEMFPRMHRRGSMAPAPSKPAPSIPSPSIPSPQVPSRAATGEAYPGAQPYEPCPCNSGRKYKFCCRSKGR